VAYGASKSGIISVTQHVAAAHGRLGIRCVALAPGLIVTANVEVSPGLSPWLDVMLRQQCTEHVGRPEDVANLVSFLVSDEAAFVTGIVIPIDGGLTCHRASLVDELALLDEAP
jgi:NAD(P)-dependent dehydrogenase (short-subunit alcohol dehydrogenase family)